MNELDDKLIIERIRSGDESAFKYVFEHNYMVLCRFANLFLHDSRLAEEKADDVLCYFWEHCSMVTITSSIRSYLMQAVKFQCINEMKSNRYQLEHNFSSIKIEENIQFLENVFYDREDPMNALLNQELEEKIMQCIEELPKECQEVFKRSRFEQKKYEEIASDLNISTNTVKYHIKNALATLQKSLLSYLKWLVLFIFLQN